MTEDEGAKRPWCRGNIEYFPDQDGACDCYCTHCGWRDHVPSRHNVRAALTLHAQPSDACVKHGKRRARSPAHT